MPVRIEHASAAPRFAGAIVLCSALVLSACASVPNPTGEMAAARTAVDAARRAGAGELAPSQLGEAQNLMTAAERAHAAKEYTTARRSAELARATADVAAEQARLARANQSRTELDETLRVLRTEAGRPATRP